MKDPVQLGLGVEPPKADRTRPIVSVPSGFRPAKSWHELEQAFRSEWEHDRKTGGYHEVRRIRLQIMVAYGEDSWKPVLKVCKRPVKKSFERYCLIADGDKGYAWPAERVENYAVMECEGIPKEDW